MSSFNGKPCLCCKRGIIQPTKYQTICSDCKRKNKEERTKRMRKIWEKNKKKRLKLKKKKR